MLTTESISELNEIFAADRICKRSDDIILPVPYAFYSQLLSWMMQVRMFSWPDEPNMFFWLSDFLRDNILAHGRDWLPGHYQIPRKKIFGHIFYDAELGSHRVPTAFWDFGNQVGREGTFYMFNQSFDYPVATAVVSTGNQYSASDILAGEQVLLQTLKFKLKITTPFCYVKTIKELVPLDDQSIYNELNLLIEYCSMLPQLVGCSSGEVFFSIFLLLCKMKGHLHVRSIVLALSSRWPSIQQLAEQIGIILENDKQNNPEELDDSSMLMEE